MSFKFRIGFLLVLLLLVFYFLVNRLTLFVWVNPYTETKSYPYIAKTIKGIEKGLIFAKKMAQKENIYFDYVFYNAYGSGFLNGNPIPNDLDYSVGINLGEYDYSQLDANEIARNIVNKMDTFQFMFNFYVNTLDDKSLYTEKSQFELLTNNSQNKIKNTKAIAETLEQALSGKEYIRYTVKKFKNTEELNLPYVMKANEILIENYEPINLYSDLVSYNKDMPKYIRTISIIPEFFVTIKQNDKKTVLEIVPESFVGERMQLCRRFFASSTFTGFNSQKFLKELSYLNDNEEYMYYRMLSYKRHLQEISNIEVMRDRPIKMLKRIMQTADIISPMLNEVQMNDIRRIMANNLNNRDIQLLNEYTNICKNLSLIQDSPNLFLKLLADNKIQNMLDVLISSINELEMRNNVDKESLITLKTFVVNDLTKMLLIESANEVYVFKKLIFGNKYPKIVGIVNASIYKLLEDKDKLDEYSLLFNSIYTDAGYHKIFLYWLDKNTIGIMEDDFTKNIKNFEIFAKENNLAAVNYKIIKKTEIPKISVKYAVWVRNANEKNANFETLYKALLKDKENFKIKYKIVY